jgi:hypothetical protein
MTSLLMWGKENLSAMRSWINHMTTLLMIGVAMLVALTAIENWQIGNSSAAIAGFGWTVTLLILWYVSELFVHRGTQTEVRDE